MIQPPNDFGYIHLAAEVERPHPLKGSSQQKKALLAELNAQGKLLVETYSDEVRRADLFDAFKVHPGAKENRALLKEAPYSIHQAAK